MPYNDALAARIEADFTTRGVKYETTRMMGGLCFKVDGKMCVGVEQSRLMARIDPAEVEAALQRPGCRPMDFTGRPMRGYVFVDIAVLKTAKELATWLDLTLAFNPKAVASKKAKTARTKTG